MKGFTGFMAILVFLASCKPGPKEKPLFEALDDTRTGLHFTNQLTANEQFNLFKYMYFYNGAGLGAGDFNNDGLVDLFFSSSQGQNTLYLNSGNLTFKDVTKEAQIPNDSGWSTGISVVDINNDGLLDIYVCRVGKYEILNSHNLLLVCNGIKNGIPTYTDKSNEYGLDFSGFSTQAAFFDFDLDGDLDMFLLNHSIHENGTFRPRAEFLGTYHPLSGDRIYRNDGNPGSAPKFTDVTRESGINSSAIGYGLGIAIADINFDGYPDLYIGNDFHENDYLYINQRNGTFKESLNQCIMHTSQFSMGVDIADINNDGCSEIITVDMLPSDPYVLKRSLGEDAFDIYNEKLKNGYNNQFTRNNLQFNRGDSMFSETGLYSGIFATDWSWGPLWIDFDNDGLKDLFISNGIPKRMNDIDYINYISNQEIQKKIRDSKMNETDMALIDKFPQIKIPNKFFKNTGSLAFKDIEPQIAHNKSTFSNGAVYADFDNDGDIDVVVNNINDPALLYENKANDDKSKKYVDIKLIGPAGNINATGSKVILFANGGLRLYEKYPVHGFQSSMEIPLHIGLDSTKVDSSFLIWPDNTYQPLTLQKDSGHLQLSYTKNLPLFAYSTITSFVKHNTRPMEDVTQQVKLQHKHVENPFVEFDREPLIPHMVSAEGPALAVADINKDGFDDIFFGSAKREKSAIYLQQPSGGFLKTAQPALDSDSTYEDVDACWTDVNNDGTIDLVVATGGNEYYGHDAFMLPRVYLNDGKANFTRRIDAFDSIYMTASCVVANDFNGDGFVDLFIGGRAVPWAFGEIPRSYLLQNDGTGKFKDVTGTYAKELSHVGFVTSAVWNDVDKDGDKDLVLSLEWGGIVAFQNNKTSFAQKILSDKKGWWNFVIPCDVDNDGNIDFIAGNLGLNSRLKANDKEPVRLYYNDFDDNGKKEQVLTYYVKGKEIPFANKAELEKQMPVLRKRFLYAEDFAKATLKDLFTPEKLESAQVLTANYFDNAVLLNKGNWQFETSALPWQAQLTSYRDATVLNANNDPLPDVLLLGNFYNNNIEMGRYDADYGTILVNKGKGVFDCQPVNGLDIKGQARHVRVLFAGRRETFVLAMNNDSARVISFKDKF